MSDLPRSSAARLAWPKPTDRSAVHAKKKRLILETAARAFADNGYHETTIASIADKLEITKPTVYYYVKNKDDILFEIAKAALADLEQSLQASCDAGASPRDRLLAICKAYGRMITSDLGVCMALVADRSLSPLSRKKLRMYKKQLETRVTRIVEECARDGSMAVEHPRLLSYALFGAFNWMPQWYSPKGAIPIDEISTYFFEIFSAPRGAARAGHSGGRFSEGRGSRSVGETR